MALEIKTQAGNSSSVSNEMLFVVYEGVKAIDPVTYPDYAYICDVYVDSEFKARLISRPMPDNNMGVFDV